MDKETYSMMGTEEAQALFCLMRDNIGLSNGNVSEDLGRTRANVTFWVTERKPPFYAFQYLEQCAEDQRKRFENWRRVADAKAASGKRVTVRYVRRKRDEASKRIGVTNRDACLQMEYLEKHGIAASFEIV